MSAMRIAIALTAVKVWCHSSMRRSFHWAPEHGTDMAIGTILIYLNDRRRAERLIEAAQGIAAPFSARLVGLHVFSSLPPLGPVVIPYGEDVIAAIQNAESREATAIESKFRELTADLGERATWISEQTAGPDLAEHVMQHGRGSDLIVASVADTDWEMAPVLDFPERLAMESGRPVLMVPNAGSFGTAPMHAVVAWNGSRESARAGFDALDLLQASARITVLVIDDDDADERRLLSAQGFADATGRHGFAVQVVQKPAAGRSIGAAICDEAEGLGGDLTVMGAYGHSRFREFVFGGATRHVTHHMAIPTLLSH